MHIMIAMMMLICTAAMITAMRMYWSFCPLGTTYNSLKSLCSQCTPENPTSHLNNKTTIDQNISTTYAWNPLHLHTQLRFTTIHDLCMCCGSYLHVGRSFFISQVPCTQKLLLISAQGIAPPTLTPPTKTTESIGWIKHVISDYRKMFVSTCVCWYVICFCVFTWT